DVTVKPKEAVEDTRGGEPPAFSAGLLQTVKRTDGVAEAAGSIFDPTIAILDEHNKRIGPQGPPHIAASVVPARFSPWTYPEGRRPQTPDEMAIDSITAKAEGFKVGDQIRVAGQSGA